MDNVLKKAYDALNNWKKTVTVDEFVNDNKRLKNEATNQNSPSVKDILKSKRRNNYEPGQLYILISNNRENLSVAEYLHEQEYPNFSLPIFRDVVTKEDGYAMCKCIAYTEKRFKALSKLDWTEVVVLMYHTDDVYDIETAPTKDQYIDPMLNYQNIMNALKEQNQ